MATAAEALPSGRAFGAGSSFPTQSSVMISLTAQIERLQTMVQIPQAIAPVSDGKRRLVRGSSTRNATRLTCGGRRKPHKPFSGSQPANGQVKYRLLSVPRRNDKGKDRSENPESPFEPAAEQSHRPSFLSHYHDGLASERLGQVRNAYSSIVARPPSRQASS